MNLFRLIFVIGCFGMLEVYSNSLIWEPPANYVYPFCTEEGHFEKRILIGSLRTFGGSDIPIFTYFSSNPTGSFFDLNPHWSLPFFQSSIILTSQGRLQVKLPSGREYELRRDGDLYVGAGMRAEKSGDVWNVYMDDGAELKYSGGKLVEISEGESIPRIIIRSYTGGIDVYQGRSKILQIRKIRSRGDYSISLVFSGDKYRELFIECVKTNVNSSSLYSENMSFIKTIWDEDIPLFTVNEHFFSDPISGITFEMNNLIQSYEWVTKTGSILSEDKRIHGDPQVRMGYDYRVSNNGRGDLRIERKSRVDGISEVRSTNPRMGKLSRSFRDGRKNVEVISLGGATLGQVLTRETTGHEDGVISKYSYDSNGRFKRQMINGDQYRAVNYFDDKYVVKFFDDLVDDDLALHYNYNNELIGVSFRGKYKDISNQLIAVHSKSGENEFSQLLDLLVEHGK